MIPVPLYRQGRSSRDAHWGRDIADRIIDNPACDLVTVLLPSSLGGPPHPADRRIGAPVRIAVLGLGEAGRRYATDLVAAGWQVTGTKTHAARRVHEVEASRDYLAELGVRTSVCEAALAWLGELAAQPAV